MTSKLSWEYDARDMTDERLEQLQQLITAGRFGRFMDVVTPEEIAIAIRAYELWEQGLPVSDEDQRRLCDLSEKAGADCTIGEIADLAALLRENVIRKYGEGVLNSQPVN